MVIVVVELDSCRVENTVGEMDDDEMGGDEIDDDDLDDDGWVEIYLNAVVVVAYVVGNPSNHFFDHTPVVVGSLVNE